MADANTYLPFKLVDKAVTKRIMEELDSLSDAEDEGKTYLNVGYARFTTMLFTPNSSLSTCRCPDKGSVS